MGQLPVPASFDDCCAALLVHHSWQPVGRAVLHGMANYITACLDVSADPDLS